MNNLNFNTEIGTKITFDSDGKRYIVFDTESLDFYEAFTDMQKKLVEISKKEVAKPTVSEDGQIEDNGFLGKLKSDFDVIKVEFDKVFGKGASEMLFDGNYSYALLEKFINFVAEETSKARNANLAKLKAKKKKSNKTF